jgi:hypothetical protein
MILQERVGMELSGVIISFMYTFMSIFDGNCEAERLDPRDVQKAVTRVRLRD